MTLKYLIPTIKNACSAALIGHELKSIGPRAGFVLGFDLHGDPHILYVEDAANTKRPAHIVDGELLAFDLSSITSAVASLNLSTEQAVEKMFCALFSNLPPILYSQNSTDPRIKEIAGELNNYAFAGMVAMITKEDSPEKQTEQVEAQRIERN